MNINELDFKKGNGLIPAIVQDTHTMQVLMLGYMNEEALEKTLNEKKVTFYSRSKQRLWTKGETSGNTLELVDIQSDCDEDTLLILARPHGPTCHTGDQSCFHEKEFKLRETSLDFLDQLERLIQDRRIQRPEGSYTTSLFDEGIDKIAQKVGEEAVETVIEAKNNRDDKFTGEVADLLYHLLVLLTEKEIPLAKIINQLKDRHNVKSSQK